MARKHTAPTREAPAAPAQVTHPEEAAALPALVAEMVQAVGKAAAEPVEQVAVPVVMDVAPKVGPDACGRYGAGISLVNRTACPWERTRAAGVPVYRCADCGAERPR